MAPNRNSLRRRSARRKKTCGQKFLDFLRALAAFIFSNVGIVCLIVGYTILGAFLFAAIEKSQTTDDGHRIAEVRQTMLEKLWSTTMQFNTFTEKSWRDNVTEEIIKFQNQVVSAVQAGNYDEVGAVRNRWTFSASFLYSLTVITTIGYGNITPTTEWGKFATIVYAIGGMPIFLLFLSNIGTLLAKSCKWTYAKCVLCKGCEPERLRQFQVDKAIQRNMQRNTPSPQICLRRGYAVRQMGKLGAPRRRLFLLHIAKHHRLRRPRPGCHDKKQGGRCRARVHILLNVPPPRHGPHRHVLQPYARRGRTQTQVLLGNCEKDTANSAVI
ncbi:TWiK family of potassium channels protein 7 isoform X2 [Cimex lectularius]|uniref:Potassium channel domain-containing protein n=1 Tax=Cimex lectularius TaxID=79782 RepID=A0A8I6SMH7_CIMLE|nr:TWiK family of potassium channels protein 7 isoform X2 [Cimex lectularius]